MCHILGGKKEREENLLTKLEQGPANMISPGIDTQGIIQCYDLLLNLVRGFFFYMYAISNLQLF